VQNIKQIITKYNKREEFSNVNRDKFSETH